MIDLCSGGGGVGGRLDKLINMPKGSINIIFLVLINPAVKSPTCKLPLLSVL